MIEAVFIFMFGFVSLVSGLVVLLSILMVLIVPWTQKWLWALAILIGGTLLTDVVQDFDPIIKPMIVRVLTFS